MNWRKLLPLFFLIPFLWGCPTRRLVPDPIPPEPSVNMSLNWRQLESWGGMAPLVGPTPYFIQMVASNEKNLP